MSTPSPAGATLPDSAFHRAAFYLLAALGLFRLWFAAHLPLSPDECYYWQWSQHIDWCYYSKGPMVAWFIWLGTHLGGNTELGVRWLAVVLHIASALLLYRFALRFYGARIAFATLLAAVCVPLFAVGSVLMTIDPLSVFFWLSASITAWNAFSTEGRSRLGWYALTGLLIGLGMLSKPTNIVQLACIALFLLLTARGRKQLFSLGPWLMLFTALLCTAPILIWNAQNHWVTFGHLIHRAALEGVLGNLVGQKLHTPEELQAASALVDATARKGFRLSPSEFFQFLTAQMIVFSPLLWLLVFAALGTTLRSLWQQRSTLDGTPDSAPTQELHLICHGLPLILLFSAFAWNDSGQPNWTVPGYFTLFILAAKVWLPRCFPANPATAPRWPRILYICSLVLGALMTAGLHDTSWLKLPAQSDPYTIFRGWPQIAAKVEEAFKQQGASFLLADHYQRAAAITWHGPNFRANPDRFIYISHNPFFTQNQYDFWPDYQERLGQSAIFISTRKGTPANLRAEFEKVTPLGEPFWTEENGRQVQRWRLFYCENYLGRETQKKNLLNMARERAEKRAGKDDNDDDDAPKKAPDKKP